LLRACGRWGLPVKTRARAKGVETAPPLPRYQQIKDFITRKIQDGSWKPGDRVSSEQELVAQFRVSRMTANRALHELSEQGRVVRMAGMGTFVATEKTQSTLLQIANLATEIEARGHEYRCDLLVLERVPANLEVANALERQTGESVWHVVCLHRENGTPVQLEDRYVNPPAAPAFGQQDFTKVQPSDYLVRNVPFDKVEHVVDAMLPTTEQAARLEMPATEPCLMLTRRTWTNRLPVTIVRCLHPGSRYRLGSKFRPDGNAQLG
jgi:GntR family histidine utilization transcriptional repressor